MSNKLKTVRAIKQADKVKNSAAPTRGRKRQCTSPSLEPSKAPKKAKDAFPTVTTISDYFQSVCIDIAGGLDLSALGEHINTDSVFLDHVCRVLSTRLCNARSSIKKVTAPKAEGSFNISGTVTERHNKVKDLVNTGDYIYPRTAGGLILRTKPFHHSIIISTIRECFFSGARGSLAIKYASKFASTIEDGPQSQELELPMAMVCIVATAVCAALDDWNTGFYKKSEFNADAYYNTYKGHEMFLANIHREKPRAYHQLMADLYNEVSNSQGSHSAQQVANNAMAILDLAAMEE